MYDYPRICVGFAVVRRGHLLVLTRGHEPKRGALDLPGGFLEAGEELEAAARRELFEETGLRVGRADDAAEAHWVPFAELGRRALQRRFAWAHMRRLVRDARRRAGA